MLSTMMLVVGAIYKKLSIIIIIIPSKSLHKSLFSITVCVLYTTQMGSKQFYEVIVFCLFVCLFALDLKRKKYISCYLYKLVQSSLQEIVFNCLAQCNIFSQLQPAMILFNCCTFNFHSSFSCWEFLGECDHTLIITCRFDNYTWVHELVLL